MRYIVNIVILFIPFLSIGQKDNSPNRNDSSSVVSSLNFCLGEKDVSDFKTFDHKYKILGELCKLYNIELMDSMSILGGLFTLKKKNYLPEDMYSFSIVLVPKIKMDGCNVNEDNGKLSQITIYTETDSIKREEFNCDDYKLAYLLQSTVKVLPEKEHEFGEFYTTSTYMVIDYKTLYIIAKGEISNEGMEYFKNDDQLEMIEKFDNASENINKYR